MAIKIEITLTDEVANRLEIRAAIDDLTVSQGIENLLEYLADHFEERRKYEYKPL